jgi:predicted dinucleotide-binding enzyme
VVTRDPSKASALAAQFAAGATAGTYGAEPAGDFVILAVPYSSATAVTAASISFEGGSERGGFCSGLFLPGVFLTL